MFREMLRKRQQLAAEECVQILKQELRGVLSVLGDDGYPYGIPLNHYYCEEDGKIYFHSGKNGHKIDALRRNGKASFCVYDSGVRESGTWYLKFRSVVVFGTMEFVEDREKTLSVSRELARKFTDDEAYIEEEIRSAGPAAQLFCMKVEHMSGKLVTER